MADREAFLLNAYESALSSAMTTTTTTMNMIDVTGLSIAPGGMYLVIDPDDPAKREYVWVSAIASLALTASERYLSGSAAASGLTHDTGAVVRMSAMAQHIDDLHDRIAADAAIQVAHEADLANPHGVTAVQTGAASEAYANAAAATVQTDVDSNQVTTDAHAANTSNPHGVTSTQTGAAAALTAHKVGGVEHPNVTVSTSGFMTAADKTKLDGISSGAGANPTPAQILTDLKTVDGAGSGLDADLLDGQSSAYFAVKATTDAHAATDHRQQVEISQLESTAALSLTPETVRHTVTFSGLSASKTYKVQVASFCQATGQASGYSVSSRCQIAGDNSLLAINTSNGGGAITANSSMVKSVTGVTSITVASLMWRDSGSVPSSVSTQQSVLLIEE